MSDPDVKRLVKFLREQGDENPSHGLASWFYAAADKMEAQEHRIAELEIPVDALHEACGGAS